MKAKQDLAVRMLERDVCVEWDHFVNAQPGGTFYHLSGWKNVIGAAFGHAPYYLYVKHNDEIQGVLPLFHVKSLLFGNSLISIPFCSYGGVVAATAMAADTLTQAACDLATELNVDYLEIRNLEVSGRDWPSKDLYVTFRVPLDADPEKNFRAIGAKRRNMVRNGMRRGLEVHIDQDVGRHYEVYAEMVRNLGTPVFSRKYFELLKKEFKGDCEILTVTLEGRALSSMMSFYFRDEMLVSYGGGGREARRAKSNDYLYWQLMRRASERGARIFDVGRSKLNTGSFDFKVHWGWQPQPLFYEYYLVNDRRIPNVSPSNPKYRYFIEAWKRLPLPLTQLVGPMLARNLG